MLVAGFENRVKQALQGKQATIFFLDRHGNIEDVSLPEEDSYAEEWGGRFTEEANIASGGSYFEICSIGPNENNDMTLFLKDEAADLSEAFNNAQTDRIRFYVERVKEFGMSALPNHAGKQLIEAARMALKATAA